MTAPRQAFPAASRALALLLLTLAFCADARAQAADDAPPQRLRPERHGYVFDQPRLLAQQRLFGMAHGVALLAAACLREPGRDETLMLAYAAWHGQQKPAIAASFQALARHYFGDHAVEATNLDVSRALRLKDKLELAPGSPELRAACDSFAATLKKPRFDLARQFRLQALAWRLATATSTQARSQVCRSRLDGDARAAFDDAMAQWQASHGAGLDEARARLEQEWDESLLEGTLTLPLAAWLAQARSDGKRSATAQRCQDMPQWLLTKQADPDDTFNPEP